MCTCTGTVIDSAPTQITLLAIKLYFFRKYRCHIDIAINRIRVLLEFFRKVRIPGFENCCDMAKQISTGLEIKVKDCFIQ